MSQSYALNKPLAFSADMQADRATELARPDGSSEFGSLSTRLRLGGIQLTKGNGREVHRRRERVAR